MHDSRHLIQIRGPFSWRDVEASDMPLLSSASETSSCERFRFPEQLAEIVQRSTSGRVLLARDFGRPANLTNDHGVVLSIDQCGPCRTISLNGERVELAAGGDGVGRCEIAARLLTRNRLQILCEFPRLAEADTLALREIRLEILAPD